MHTTAIKQEAMNIRQRAEERADRFMEAYDKPDVREWLRNFDKRISWYMDSHIIGHITRNNL